METKKKCKACLEEKELCEFNKDSWRREGIREKCKSCVKNKTPIVKVIDMVGESYTCKACHETKDLAYFYKTGNKYETKCSQCHRENKKVYKDTIYTDIEKRCSVCNIFKPFGDFYKSNFSRSKLNLSCPCIECIKKYNKENKDKIQIRKKKYLKENREELNEKERFKLKINPFYKLKKYLRISIKNTLLNQEECSKRTEEILGCNFEEFKQHIELQFLTWMSWENYGNVCGNTPDYNCSWDLDHIIPISYAKTEEDIYLLNHWSNFQPLCSKVNRWEKKDLLFSCSNLELNKTFINE